MGFEQETLIYVEQEDKSQASAAARGFAQKIFKTEHTLTL